MSESPACSGTVKDKVREGLRTGKKLNEHAALTVSKMKETQRRNWNTQTVDRQAFTDYAAARIT